MPGLHPGHSHRQPWAARGPLGTPGKGAGGGLADLLCSQWQGSSSRLSHLWFQKFPPTTDSDSPNLFRLISRRQERFPHLYGSALLIWAAIPRSPSRSELPSLTQVWGVLPSPRTHGFRLPFLHFLSPTCSTQTILKRQYTAIVYWPRKTSMEF